MHFSNSLRLEPAPDVDVSILGVGADPPSEELPCFGPRFAVPSASEEPITVDPAAERESRGAHPYEGYFSNASAVDGVAPQMHTSVSLADWAKRRQEQPARISKPPRSSAAATVTEQTPRSSSLVSSAVAVEREPPQDSSKGPVQTENEGEQSRKRCRSSEFVPSAVFDEHLQHDYQGRSFLHCPLRPSTAPSALPTRPRYALKGHGSGVQCLEWVPPLGHLMLSGDLDGKVMLWDVLASKKRIAVFEGHETAIKNISVVRSAERFTTSSLDGWLREWDTETGSLRCSVQSPNQVPFSTHLYPPDPALQHLVIGGIGSRVGLWDLRRPSEGLVREYGGHQAPVMSLCFYDRGRRFISTSEDKTVRTWDFEVPVQLQVFADVAMHAVPHVVLHPEGDIIAAQSVDNRVTLFATAGKGKLRAVHEKQFSGHVVSGTACRLQFSTDGKMISSGDATGNLFIWDFSTTQILKRFKAHTKQIPTHLWHPVEHSMVVTGGWDGMLKVWS